MPLTTKLPFVGGAKEADNTERPLDKLPVSPSSQSLTDVRIATEGEEKDCPRAEYEEFDVALDSDMEDSVMNLPRPKKEPSKILQQSAIPVLPPRSEKRASCLLDNMMLGLKSLDGSAAKDLEQRPPVAESDPHESYLSSEEDASLSDDYEDSLNDLELLDTHETGERKTSLRASSHGSQEDTARIVSFIMVGKPQIVNIYLNSSPTTIQNRHSLDIDTLTSSLSKTASKPTPHRPAPLKLYPLTSRRPSVSSIASVSSTATHYTTFSTTLARPTTRGSSLSQSISHSTSNTSLPPRKSSRLASLMHTTKNTFQNAASASHSFLNSDPYSQHSNSSANNLQEHPGSPTESTPPTPKTPTSAAAAGWRKGISRTLSKARKQSLPRMNEAYAATAASQRANMSRASLIEQPSRTKTGSAVLKFEQQEEERTLIRRSATMPLSILPGPSSTDTSKIATTTIIQSKPQGVTSYVLSPKEAPLRYEDVLRGSGGEKERSFVKGVIGLSSISRKKSQRGHRAL